MISWLKWLLGHVKTWFQVLMGVSDSETPQVHMDDDPPITSSLGPIDRLISKLQSLEASKHNLPVELSANEIGLLIKHLKEFRNPMKNLSEMEGTSLIDKWWMMEVRELCYDTEDYLEEVIMQYGADAPRTWTRLLLEDVRIPVPLGRIAGAIIFWIHSKLKWRPQLSHFLAGAEVLKGRCPSSVDKEKPDEISLNKVIRADNSLKKENIADIQNLTAQLVEMLAFDVNKTQLKVVPICGSEGSGKTILARTLYAKYKRRFQCWAFVQVPRNPDIRSILTSILSQIKAPPASPTMSQVQDLILSISTHLKIKRYFVVIDDIRRTSVWDIICRALPDDNFGSRIIITTESEHVASACSGYYLGSTIFQMDALNACTDTITSEQKNKDINLRYNNLPLHLKTCLLFLGMHPEGCTIMKDDLVKQWVAEGFIPSLKIQETKEISEIPENETEEIVDVLLYKRDGISDILRDQAEEIAELPQDQTWEIAQVNQHQREEIARGYFDELVTRGMIQPVDINHNGEVLSCRVHHLVLDLVRYKSKEDNFIVIVDNLESTLGHPDFVRRLAVQFGCEKGASIPESIILSQVRSLTFYGFLECVPSIPDYGLLRVLILSIWADEDTIFDLTRIGELYHLRYLKIECNVTIRLPSKIRRLQHLGSLELHAEVVAIPSDIGHLEKLMHVCCPSKADVSDLGDLTNLLDLQLTYSTLENLEEHMHSLRSILERLSSLRCLALIPTSRSSSVNNLPADLSRMCISCDSLCMLSPATGNIQRLKLSRHCCIFSGVPRWIGELHQLCILKITVRELSMEDIDTLRGLSALTTLSLHVQPMSAERMVFGKEGFSLLTYFKLTCTVPWLEFEAGAMPNLENLKLCFNSLIVDEQWTTPTIIIEHLPRLKEISVIIDSAGVDGGSIWQKAIRNDPRNPKVDLMGSIYYGDQRRGMVTREGSGENENNKADVRVHTQLESSGLPITEAHCREDEAEDQPFISEINSILRESESTDEDNAQVVMHSGGGHGLSHGSTHCEQVPSKEDSIDSDPAMTVKIISTGMEDDSMLEPTLDGATRWEPRISKAIVGNIHSSCNNSPFTHTESVEQTPSNNKVDTMEAALVSVATGALKPVLGKLETMLGEKYKCIPCVRNDIGFLSRELTAMEAFLLKKSMKEDPDVQDKVWMKEVRELSYDIEDSLDDFMVHAHDKSPMPGFMMKERRRISKKIDDLKKQVIEAVERHKRYKTTDAISKVNNVTVDPRALAIFQDASNLVGIDGPKNELIRLFTQETRCESSQQQPRMISIVGLGGLGKTTLACQVYKELKQQFNCHAFVTVSCNPDMMKVLRSILYQIGDRDYSSIEDIQLLISRVSNFLANKRYFIVVDDIWSVEIWNVIKFAFPRNGYDCRIITTTRMNDVAQSCRSSFSGHIYNLDPLSMVHSRKLFHKRLFNSEECPSHLEEVSSQILKKCAGLPLTIIAISGLLANKEKTKDQWHQVESSIGRGLERNSSIEGMLRVISLSYFDLPHHLKTCLLYLSVFPKDYVVGKEILIRRWIAEGFIQKKHRYTLYEAGEMSFSELINRSLIQPDFEGQLFDEVTGCRVHDTVLDFIVSKSIEENFVTIIGVPGINYDPRDKVRRLSLQNHGEIPAGVSLSAVRSLNIFGRDVKIPSLSEFKHLRALCFEECWQIEDHHLAGIGNLLHLKCLRLNQVGIRKFPEEIARLRYLETLEMNSTKTSLITYGSFPSTISPDRQLVHFVVTSCTTPDEFEGIQALEVMESIFVSRHSTEFVRRLGDLTNLRKLRLAVGSREVERELACSVRKLVKANLRFLRINLGISRNNLVEELNLPADCILQELYINMAISKVPRWMGSLVNLQKLHLTLSSACSLEDVGILGGLPGLRYIWVAYQGHPAEQLKAAMEIMIAAHPNHPVLVWKDMWIELYQNRFLHYTDDDDDDDDGHGDDQDEGDDDDHEDDDDGDNDDDGHGDDQDEGNDDDHEDDDGGDNDT